MVYTEIQVKNGKKYYYRTITYRDKGKFRKLRKYLGKELTKKELTKKEKEADSSVRIDFGKARKMKIGEKKLYKQSGAGLTITIGLPMYGIYKPVEIEEGLTIFYKGDMTYITPDLQFLHYFLAEELLPTVKEIFARMEKDPNWVKKRTNEFKKATKGFEQIGERLIEQAKNFSEKNMKKTIKLYEEFLQKDYEYWIPSSFIDMFDIFEKEIVEFIFKGKKEEMDKEDLQFLLLPDRSVYWKEKDDFEKIRKDMEKKKLSKTSKILWEKLKEHSNKYWWIKNDYQIVQRLGSSSFSLKLDENSEHPFWKTVSKRKKEITKKYSLSKDTVEKLKQFTEMAYLRDIRKKYTQIANYYIITFYHTIAKKINIPIEWSNFVVPFKEYEQFLFKDQKFLKELELRTKTGVWMLGEDVEWKSRIESSKALKLLELVENHLKGGNLIYGNTASLGKATGTAKIILRQSDFHRFKEGDILITGMTRPEFVPLMKIASAIVTDEGGLTCHAAILSRELNKPCVIATQTASKTFKDGDYLEVNANHGFVKLLKK